MENATNTKKMLGTMLNFAVNKHANRTDRGGNPYALHPIAVMHLLNTQDEELMCIALGHDLVEDEGVTYKELAEIGMSERVVNGIRCLTKQQGETYEEYKQKVKSNMDAVRVKMCDIQHNMDLRRLKGIRPKDLERSSRYQIFYFELEEIVRGLSVILGGSK